MDSSERGRDRNCQTPLRLILLIVVSYSKGSEECDPNCTGTCFKFGPGTCDAICAPGFGLNSSSNICEPCDPNCDPTAACDTDGPGTCESSCTYGYTLTKTPLATSICVYNATTESATTAHPSTSRNVYEDTSTSAPVTPEQVSQVTTSATRLETTLGSSASTAKPATLQTLSAIVSASVVIYLSVWESPIMSVITRCL